MIINAFIYLFDILISYPVRFLSFLLYRNKRIWIIGERGDDARDNGYHMFKYMCKNHPEIETWFLIREDSPDYKKVSCLGKTTPFNSFRHWLLYFSAECIMSCYDRNYYTPNHNWHFQMFAEKRSRAKIVFLQHGVIKDDLRMYHKDKTGFDIFICGAKPEYDYVSTVYGYDNHEVRYTGLARYDALHEYSVKRQVLIMPTWRNWLPDLPDESFIKENYYMAWYSLICDSRIKTLSEKYHVEFIFYPHYLMQKYLHLFRTENNGILLADIKKYDIQALLKESMLLITDYSSVMFDFAYMKKPVVYYQFDSDDVFKRHYHKGYFDYVRDGFGKVCMDKNAVLKETENVLENNGCLDDLYGSRIARFFPLHDTDNCERIYQEVARKT